MRVDASAFEEKYRTDADPWGFASSTYELDRYRMIIEQLSPFGYRRCFEPGCSIGVLTQMLANHAAEVVACDASPTAIDAARHRLRDRDNVTFVAATLPDWWPDGTFDLIVLSEFGYYWDEHGLGDLLDRLVVSADRDGTDLVTAHWLGRSPDHLLTGPEVHAILGARFGEPVVESLRPSAGPESGFVLGRWKVGR